MKAITPWKRLLAIPILTALLALATLVTFAGAAGKPSPATNGSCPNAKDLKSFVPSANVDATFSNSGNITTYTFISLKDENPTNGVPGLVKYCVYPNPFAQPTSIDAKAEIGPYDWTYGSDSSDFLFVRPSGNKSNIPLNGETEEMGTATWTDNPPNNQLILLHIADAGVCSNLYPGNTSGTCFVKPFSSTFLDACVANAGNTNAAYNAIPFGAVNCGPPSHAFEATQTKEFGDEVALVGSGPLKFLDVLFNSYACEDYPLWNNSQCTTNNPGDTFTHTITANIYAVGLNHTVGALLATATQTFAIPYRPSADTANCGNTGQWFNTVSGNCEYSVKVVLTFTNWNPTPTLSGNVIWTVKFNTSDYGDTPLRPQACNLTVAGCPYDSLNVGTKSFPGAPYVGTDVDTHGAFINSTWVGIYCDDGSGGTGFLRVSTNPPTPCTNTEAVSNYSATAWLDFKPLGEIRFGP